MFEPSRSMSECAGGPGEGGIELLLQRFARASGPAVPCVDDHLGWARTFLRRGDAAAAHLLYGIAFLRQGFSRQHQIARAALASDAGLEDSFVDAQPRAVPFGVGTVDIAMAEIVALARQVGAVGGVNRLVGQGKLADPMPDSDVPIGDVGDAIRTLCNFLSSPQMVGCKEVDALLARIAAAGTCPHFDCRAFAGAPLPLLAEAMAFAGLQEFLLANHDLISGSAGAALLHVTARFDSAGLGPYLENVGRIASKSRDVFALAEIAAEASDGTGERLSWVVLLSRGLKGPLLYEVVDDLGDAGEMWALEAMFDRAKRGPDDCLDLPLILRIRDVALDNGDWEFAARAQARIVRAQPLSGLEKVILGSIQATGGLIAAAEQTFLDSMAHHPELQEGDLPERILALRAHEFGPFEVTEGYGSPAERRIRRQKRRRVTQRQPMLQHVRPVAVEL